MRLLALLLLCGTSACAPVGIPARASAHWDFKGGFHWTWTSNLEHGCAAWMANDRWADVQLLVDSHCESTRQTTQPTGRGVSYFSASDHLTFHGYWPWSGDLYSKLTVFDENGMISDIRPCPYALSAKQIEAMLTVAQEAHTAAQTDAERRVLARLRQRITSLSGATLASGQGGCTDLPAEYNAPVRRDDVWASR